VPRLFRQKIVEYRLPGGKTRTPDGKRVTSKTPGAVRSECYASRWYGEWRSGGEVFRRPLSESKATAQRMLNKLAGDAELASVGLVDPFAEHKTTPLAEHLEDYCNFLAGKGDTPEHVARQRQRVEAVLGGCGMETTGDLDASAVVDFLAGLRTQDTERVPLPVGQEEFTKAELVALVGLHPGGLYRLMRIMGLTATGKGRKRRYGRAVVAALQERLRQGRGPATCNHYLAAVKGFTRWLARGRRVPADPLGHLSGQNADVDVRRRRRALREESFARFVEATGSGKACRGLAGPDRLVLYTLAANTGFRANELSSLTPGSFALEGGRPAVTVAAAYSKHRREDVQPLRPDVAAMLRQYLQGKPRSEPVWPGAWADNAAEMIRADLAAAGIPYADEEGRYFDFHALRGQFISLLAASGVHPKVAQVLARHSSITLTMDYYTHLDVLDVTGALDKLPELPGTKKAEPGQKERRRVS
jgi:integrase